MNDQIYIKAELLFLVPVMNFIGAVLKRCRINNRYIPIILSIISVTVTVSWILISDKSSAAKRIAYDIFEGCFQGILISGVSVYANQLLKQITKKK